MSNPCCRVLCVLAIILHHLLNGVASAQVQQGSTYNPSEVPFPAKAFMSVLDFGARCDGRSPILDTAAFRKAAAIGSRVYIPEGRCRLNASIKLKSGTQLVGSGRPRQFMYGDGSGTVLDFNDAPVGADGFIADETLQMIYISDLQVERAPRHGMNISSVYSTFDRVTFAYNGGDGLHLENSFLTQISSCLSEMNGGNGFSDTVTNGGQYTTLQVNNSEAMHNKRNGWFVQRVNSIALIGSGADDNAESGYRLEEAFASFIAADSERNGNSGYSLMDTNASIISSTGAANSQVGSGSDANFISAMRSTVWISSSYDLAPKGSVPSIIAGLSSVLVVQQSRWQGKIVTDTTSSIRAVVTSPMGTPP